LKIKKWLISLVVLSLTLTTAGAVTAFTLTNDGGSDSADRTNVAGEVNQGVPTYEEWLSNYKATQGAVTSIDDIDPNVCNPVHNINACSPEELEDFRALTEIAWEETHGKTEPGVKGEVVASGALTDETGEDFEVEPGSEYGDTEPLLVDGESGYTVQPVDEAVIEDCSLAGGTVYVTSEGELGCEVVHDLEDDSDELATFSQPPTTEPQPVPAPR